MIRINLLPDDGSAKKGLGFQKSRVIPVALLAAVIVASGSVAMVQKNRVDVLEQEVADARAETEKYKATIALINEMVAKERELNRRLDLVQQLDKDRFRTVQIMDEVARRIPRYMWLTSLKNVSPDRVSIDGYAFSNLVVSDLMSRLEESEMFDNIELSIAKRKLVDGQAAVNFTVTSTVKPMKLGES